MLKTGENAQSGVTLIELMIALVIVGILVAIAVPNYTSRVLRANRGDATATLLTIAAEQEKFFLKNNAYSDSPAALGIAESPEQMYGLSIALTADGGYTATANALTGVNTAQHKDTGCRLFMINHTGLKTAEDDSGGNTSTECW